MKFIIKLLLLIFALGSSGYIYQMFIAENKTTHLVEQIEHELSAMNTLIISRDTISFREQQQYESGFSHITYQYSWDADVSFGFDPDALQLMYDKATRTLEVHLDELHLVEFSVKNQQTLQTEKFAWLGKNPAASFWMDINAHTEQLIIKEFSNDRQLSESTLRISGNSLSKNIAHTLAKLDLAEIKLKVFIRHIRLRPGGTLDTFTRKE